MFDAIKRHSAEEVAKMRAIDFASYPLGWLLTEYRNADILPSYLSQDQRRVLAERFEALAANPAAWKQYKWGHFAGAYAKDVRGWLQPPPTGTRRPSS